MPVTSIINNVSEIYKDKMKSPFVGTFIFWWFVFHRVELYDLFFNDQVLSEGEREIIQNMFFTSDAFLCIIYIILCSIVSVISYYIIQYFMYSKVIYKYENIWKPKALKANEGKVIPQNKYDQLKELYEKSKIKLDEKDQELINRNNHIDDKNILIEELKKNKLIIEDSYTSLEKKFRLLNNRLDLQSQSFYIIGEINYNLNNNYDCTKKRSSTFIKDIKAFYKMLKSIKIQEDDNARYQKSNFSEDEYKMLEKFHIVRGVTNEYDFYLDKKKYDNVIYTLEHSLRHMIQL